MTDLPIDIQKLKELCEKATTSDGMCAFGEAVDEIIRSLPQLIALYERAEAAREVAVNLLPPIVGYLMNPNRTDEHAQILLDAIRQASSSIDSILKGTT